MVPEIKSSIISFVVGIAKIQTRGPFPHHITKVLKAEYGLAA